MATEITPSVNLQMLFRVPVERVFEAFVNPELTTRFWFTHSSGPLAVGQEVTWEWRQFGASTCVLVQELAKNERIVMEWGDEGKRSTVVWTFTRRGAGAALVEVTNSGFVGTAAEVVAEAIDTSSGFSLVLANAKALLEHGIDLNLINDRFPGDDGERAD